MSFLSDTELQEIASAIEAAERKTDGELVTVIARAADPYSYIPVLWPALIALALPAPLLLAWPSMAAEHVYAAQIGLFIVLEILLLIPAAKVAVVPRSVKHRRARRLAREQFIEQGLHRTRDRTGVLVFVSIAERYVEIIADAGINDKVPTDSWDKMVGAFVADVRAGRVADGFLAVVSAAGDLLAEHFPRTEEPKNELPNRVVEI